MTAAAAAAARCHGDDGLSPSRRLSVVNATVHCNVHTPLNNKNNNNKLSKNFDERPHWRLVTPRGCEWIRPMLTPANTCFFGLTRVSRPNGISIGSAVVAGHIRMIDGLTTVTVSWSLLWQAAACPQRLQLPQVRSRAESASNAWTFLSVILTVCM